MLLNILMFCCLVFSNLALNQCFHNVFSITDDAEDYYREDLLREINLMKILGKHPNIVSMIGACTAKEPLALIM